LVFQSLKSSLSAQTYAIGLVRPLIPTFRDETASAQKEATVPRIILYSNKRLNERFGVRPFWKDGPRSLRRKILQFLKSGAEDLDEST